jgi:hypothetical protein
MREPKKPVEARPAAQGRIDRQQAMNRGRVLWVMEPSPLRDAYANLLAAMGVDRLEVVSSLDHASSQLAARDVRLLVMDHSGSFDAPEAEMRAQLAVRFSPFPFARRAVILPAWGLGRLPAATVLGVDYAWPMPVTARKLRDALIAAQVVC